MVAHPLQFRARGCDDAAVKTQDFSFAVSSYTLKAVGPSSSTEVGVDTEYAQQSERLLLLLLLKTEVNSFKNLMQTHLVIQ